MELAWLYGLIATLLLIIVITAIILIVFKRFPWLRYDFKLASSLGNVFMKLKYLSMRRTLLVDLFEEKVRKNPTKPFIIFQGEEHSYDEVNKRMNRVADVGQRLGLEQGDVVALLMQNEPAFVWTYYGLSKIGVQSAFLNYNLRNKALLHCFAVSGAKLLIVGQSNNDELLRAVQEIHTDLVEVGVTVYTQGHVTDNTLGTSFKSLDSLLEEASDSNVPKRVRANVTSHTPLCYIYTSGTTGLPKAAVISQDRGLRGALLMPMLGINENDVIYSPLPLYHSVANLVALGATISQGATLVLRLKFSASHFWEDCRKYNVTVIQYIGELCRYLVARPPSADDCSHRVRVACGNGLRRDIWSQFTERFNIPVIAEFYAATEGNAGLINVHNKFGSVGRASPLMNRLFPVAFIRYDLVQDEPVRDANGRCLPVGSGEPGLLVVKIKRNFEFDGYKGNRELTDKKILTDVFSKGDKYFNSGDLLLYDEDYFVYFSDRLGDTFRWKGENVSTVEVANVIADQAWIEDANVYGVAVAGYDGRAGMATITIAAHHELNSVNLGLLYDHCEQFLPAYARPRFIRVQRELELTGTFKQRKVELMNEGFDPDMMKGDPLFVMNRDINAFVAVDTDIYQAVLSGSIRL